MYLKKGPKKFSVLSKFYCTIKYYSTFKVNFFSVILLLKFCFINNGSYYNI